MAYRSEWFEKVAAGRSVLQIALDVHSTKNGSLERGHSQQLDDMVALREAVSGWQKSVLRDYQKFDDLVAEIIHVALTEKSVA